MNQDKTIVVIFRNGRAHFADPATVKSYRIELLEKIEKLESETGITLAVNDPKQYKANNKKIERMRRKLLNINAGEKNRF